MYSQSVTFAIILAEQMLMTLLALMGVYKSLSGKMRPRKRMSIKVNTKGMSFLYFFY